MLGAIVISLAPGQALAVVALAVAALLIARGIHGTEVRLPAPHRYSRPADDFNLAGTRNMKFRGRR